MKAKPTTKLQRNSEQGVALIIVLSMIVLLTALVVAFMTSTRDDLAQVASYEAGRGARMLADTAQNLVMSQIREATLSGINTQGKGTYAWASQPGAIRVWDDDGDFVQLYKLYSAAKMKEGNMGFLAGEIPSDWLTHTDAYVDLNEPVNVGSSNSPVWRYPIIDPTAFDTVEGFSSTQAQVAGLAWNTKAQMPVRWLYVSRNGEFHNSRQNDSIGRIAFWTDDETCKVNINTASATASYGVIEPFPPGSSTSGSESKLGYSYWDIPYTQLQQDWNMGRSAPSQAEYQRYGGHPASVNLLTILGGKSFAGLPETEKKQILKNVFSLFPAYRWGGSENNRIPWTLNRTPLSGSNQKNERLYASVDEMRFSMHSTTNERAENALSGEIDFNEIRLDRWRFLLTAHSRSPDLNLFGQPRVTIWPIHFKNDANHRTTQDHLIAFCSTYGPSANSEKKEYFFQRKNALSQTEDWLEIARNQKLFAYLQDATSRDIPGFGGNFKGKYDAGAAHERDQILTEIFDYIRCVNLNEAFEFKPSGFVSYTPTIDVPPSAQHDTAAYNQWNDANYLSYKGAGMVLPIYMNHGTYSTRGAGRVPLLSEVALFAMQQGEQTSPEAPITGKGEIQTALFFETFSPMQGYMPWTPFDFQLQVRTNMTIAGMEPFPQADTSEGVSSSPFNRSIIRQMPHMAHQPVGGTDGFAWTFGRYPEIYENALAYPFARHRGNAIPLPPAVPPATESKMEVSSGSIHIDFLMSGIAYQHYELAFPSATLEPPEPSNPTVQTTTNADWMQRRSFAGMEFKPEDVAHSLVPKDGDYRITAYLQNVPEEFFRPHPDYGTHQHFAHSLRQRRYFAQTGSSFNDGTSNGAFTGISYADIDISSYSAADLSEGKPPGYFWTTRPDIPPDITDLIAKGWTGDWNNGVGGFPDGAYLGKADDGIRNYISSALYLETEFNWYSGAGFFSPTQQMPSAVMFGSLPTGVKKTVAAYVGGNDSQAAPWRTLLFCANPAIGSSSHFGASSPHDSLLLDLFTMPVVEPYAISEPSSTAGRVNMNYQILPFTSITRASSLYAVLSSQNIPALPNSISSIRHGHPRHTEQGIIQANTTRIHHEINISATLEQFETRFGNNDIFRSATEICKLWLIPSGETLSSIVAWWAVHRATGDNLRERPYATLYPLLTTKSNTYTVHVWTQSLASNSDRVTGEYRGSSTIERYIDPGDDRLVSTEYNPDDKSIEPLYRFRVIETTRFAP